MTEQRPRRRAASGRARRAAAAPAELAQGLAGEPVIDDVIATGDGGLPASDAPPGLPAPSDGEQPARPVERPTTSAEPPAPAQPGSPAQPPAPKQPGSPAQPSTPEQPGSPAEPSTPDQPSSPVVAVVAEPPAAEAQAGEPELELPSNLAILPSRDAVLYPGMLMPMQASEPQWVRLLNDAVSARQPIGLVLLRQPTLDPSQFDNLHQVGTAANIVRLLKLPDGSLQVLLQGAARIRLAQGPSQVEPYLRSDVQSLPSGLSPSLGQSPSVQTEALVKNLQSLFQRVVSLSPVLPDEMGIAAVNVDDPGRLADFIAANIDLDSAQRQDILQELDPLVRAHRVTELVTRELEVLEIGSKIQSQIRESMEKTQRDFYLRQQLEAIRKELGESDSDEAALTDLRAKLAGIHLPPEAQAEATRELSRLASIPAASPEHSMVRTYLEWLADLPWDVATQDDLDLHHAKQVLDEDHFDLTRVKDRILEYLAVMKLRAERDAESAAAHSATDAAPETVAASVRGPILCLVGPPGVGKTSLGQSVARALGRKFVHMSLGGVRDEAEIRGHRRTYIGALPGRIIQALRRAGSRNPVFILDELDKLGSDWRGDPSSALLEVLDPAQNADFRGDPQSALLEVLDPEQNNTFRDHYLDLPFDLSHVLFICTANQLETISPALRDRMEIITLSGYTEFEKLQIAKRYLLRKQRDANGLRDTQAQINDQALRGVINDYTREAGVRNLEREIGTIFRKVARKIAEEPRFKARIKPESLTEYLSKPRFYNEVRKRMASVGVATGLAWTPV
ncbi:MAG: LON peptidase substrate-binding domain-containing protein, partial [Chloroflexi bacterium]|nr:LON peptidase substrate-binding domain-containing protein [Chloroflexota bacterium]